MGQAVNPHSGTGILAESPGDGILIAYGRTVPTDATAGYSPGCLFIKTDGTAGACLYVNDGSKASCDFDAFGDQ